MILTVTLNAALDVTYGVERLAPRSSHRVEATHERAGGKGVNVSRVLRALGHETVATGLCGGPTGDAVRRDLAAAGLPDAFVPIAADSRRTVTVVSREDGDATVFNPAGPPVQEAEWRAFTARFQALAARAAVVVLSGSLPPGAPADAYARLVRDAAGAGAATVLDTSGPPLLAGVAARPDVVKPNAAELAAATGTADVPTAAAALRRHGAAAVVASRGPAGLYAVTARGSWRAVPAEELAGNPTGAGDACVAALAAGLAARTPWPETLRDAAALSAAAVPCPVAGEFDADTFHRLRTSTPVEEIRHAPRTER
ncbi:MULTISPECIES: 1-phosphofructokinase family hexose kinase [Streptomyces]|uniref:1-phosphofructokinase family hexose kinase n=1 Tax=Streptomyces TaxID=1883 RepID=UPI00224956E7|nr:1-phosphofructokinase family hexose kinase [Streptomyces sp. JHD 1]MCX2970881.1 1-phosphofructokinase family hexose kinase [Streptomyces sp. JHD 1]